MPLGYVGYASAGKTGKLLINEALTRQGPRRNSEACAG